MARTAVPRWRRRHIRILAEIVGFVYLVTGGCGSDGGGELGELGEAGMAGEVGEVRAAPPGEVRAPPPPADVARLVEDALTDEGERIFYRANPRVLDQAEFEVACPFDHELTVVLGCYIDGAIGILRVDRPELARVMEVTAAHEMLHAAYVALPRREREKVDGWLEAFYVTVDDPEIRELITQYERQGPEVRLNELHSILPTELVVLSPDLETYYRRYFSDRQRVVAAHESYATVFRDIERRVASLHTEIERSKAQLASLDARITTTKTELDAMNARLDQLRAQGNLGTYNSLIPQQNGLVDRYNRLIDQYNEAVDVHNAKVDEVNALALEQDELATSLGSKPTPARPRS